MALSLDGDDDELLGALDIGDPEYLDALADVGRRRRRQRGGRGRGRGMVPYRKLVPTVPGAPSVGLRMQPFGLPSIVFTATSGAALSTSDRPQRPFQAKRVIIDVTRVGATSTGAVTITALKIGSVDQSPGGGAMPVSMFASGGFDLNLELSPAQTAIDIKISAALALPTLLTTDTVTLSCGMVGLTAGS